MTSQKKFKLNGKPLVKTKKITTVPPNTNKQTTDILISPVDQAVIDKIEELHVYLTQQGIPYLIVTQTPLSKKPIRRFSFNHEHNKPIQTAENAEMIFIGLGDMIQQITQGFWRLIKFY